MDTKTVKMLQSIRVAPDGINAISVTEGQVINLPSLLADGLIRDKLAVLVLPSKQAAKDSQPDPSQDPKNDDPSKDPKK